MSTKPTPPSLPKLLTIPQVANATEFSTRQIRRWIESGELAACRFGRALRIAEPDLALFIAKKKYR
jgi:excisionase family DNA binding protein